jgi:hypothetical protein
MLCAESARGDPEGSPLALRSRLRRQGRRTAQPLAARNRQTEFDLNSIGHTPLTNTVYAAAVGDIYPMARDTLFARIGCCLSAWSSTKELYDG